MCEQEHIPLAEMEGLSLTSDIMSEKSWSLALTDDSLPDDIVFSVLESKNEYSPLQRSSASKESNLLSVKKPLVCRTHSLPNDSYMLQTEHVCTECQTKRKTSCQKSGSNTHVDSSCLPQEAVLNDGKSELVIPKLTAPKRSPSTHRMLQRQKAVQNDSFDIFSDNKESDQSEAPESIVTLPFCRLPTNVPTVLKSMEPERTLCDMEKKTVYTQHCHDTVHCPGASQTSRNTFKEPTGAQERTHLLNASQCKKHFSLKTCETLRFYSAAYSLSQKVKLENSNNVVLRDMKKFYSMDAHGALKKTTSWLEDARRHSIEICSMENTMSHYPASRSCGFISHILNEREDFQTVHNTSGHIPYCPECMPPGVTRGHPCLEAEGLRRQSYSLDSKDLPKIVDPLVTQMSIS